MKIRTASVLWVNVRLQGDKAHRCVNIVPGTLSVLLIKITVVIIIITSTHLDIYTEWKEQAIYYL